MSKLFKTSVICAAAALCGADASAALFGLVPDGVQLGLGVSGTSGVNGFVGYANKNSDSFWWKRLGFRVDFASTTPIKSKLNSELNEAINKDGKGLEIADDLHVTDVALGAKHFGAMVDFYPFGNTWFLGGWRLSGGYFTGKFNLGANLKSDLLPGGDYEFELDDIKYKYSGGEMRATSSADWNYRGPYVGTGFDLGLLFGLKIYFDAGVVFANKSAQLDLDVPVTGLYQQVGGTWVAVENNATLEAILAEAESEVLHDGQKELDKYKMFPIVKLGFMYQF